MGIHDHDRGHQKDQANVGGYQVVEARKAHLLVAEIPDDQLPGGQGGNLPPKQEDQGVIGAVHQDEGQGREVEQRKMHSQVACAVKVAPHVTDRVKASQQGHGQ